MNITQLPWDSELFGYPVGILKLNGEDFSQNEFVAESNGFRLVYVTNSKSMNAPLLSCGDSRLVFSKTPENQGRDVKVVSASTEHGSVMKELGLQSGLWSRFALDPLLRKGEFNLLYEKWVERSLLKEIAYETLTVMIDSQPGGLITLAEEGTGTSIGLFAVAKENRGQGIGKLLLEAAETISFSRGDGQLSVATQGKNKDACEVYRRHGFEVKSETYIYNYWNEAFSVQ